MSKLAHETRRALLEYLYYTGASFDVRRSVLAFVEKIVEAETSDLRERHDEWMDLAMKGEALREQMLLDSILGKHTLKTEKEL